jgi:hypothetical protein
MRTIDETLKDIDKKLEQGYDRANLYREQARRKAAS